MANLWDQGFHDEPQVRREVGNGTRLIHAIAYIVNISIKMLVNVLETTPVADRGFQSTVTVHIRVHHCPHCILCPCCRRVPVLPFCNCTVQDVQNHMHNLSVHDYHRFIAQQVGRHGQNEYCQVCHDKGFGIEIRINRDNPDNIHHIHDVLSPWRPVHWNIHQVSTLERRTRAPQVDHTMIVSAFFTHVYFNVTSLAIKLDNRNEDPLQIIYLTRQATEEHPDLLQAFNNMYTTFYRNDNLWSSPYVVHYNATDPVRLNPDLPVFDDEAQLLRLRMIQLWTVPGNEVRRQVIRNMMNTINSLMAANQIEIPPLAQGISNLWLSRTIKLIKKLQLQRHHSVRLIKFAYAFLYDQRPGRGFRYFWAKVEWCAIFSSTYYRNPSLRESGLVEMRRLLRGNRNDNRFILADIFYNCFDITIERHEQIGGGIDQQTILRVLDILEPNE